MIFCNQDISKTITALSFKLGQLPGENKKKVILFFSSYCLLYVLLDIENLMSQKLLPLGASNLDS